MTPGSVSAKLKEKESLGNSPFLNLVRRICERFHWTITLESTPGEGTVATVKFV